MHAGGSLKTLRVASTLLFAAAIVACGHAAPKTTWLVVETTPYSGIDLAHTRAQGLAVRHLTLSGSKIVVELDANRAGGVVLLSDGACPLVIPDLDVRSGRTVHRVSVPWLDFGAPAPAMGFGATLDIGVTPGCPEAAAGRIAWRQTAGAPLRNVHVGRDGYRFLATMPSLRDALGAEPPWGIIPLSPRTRGEVELTARWTGGARAKIIRVLHVGAAARSHGLPNVALGTRLYFGGEGFRLSSLPLGSRATIYEADGVASLLPDLRGSYTLIDSAGRSLRIVAGKYDETPLDCGRSNCHAGLAEAARSSPMATVLERGLAKPFPGDYPGCAIGCHATGEPGIDDGGFVAVARELGIDARDIARTGWRDLPSALRRLGGVGCLGCHGPGAIPEPGGRFAILRADVCATCHDAPPRYGHVVAWRTSRMARADADPRTRTDGACARCHTTWGFLGRNDWKAPDAIGAIGIACSACHDVHPAHGVAAGRASAASLLRDVPLPSMFRGLPASAERGRICVSCHAPDGTQSTPSASAAAIWAGRGGVSPENGKPLNGPAPHLAIEGGCVGCHRNGPATLELGADHAFAARRDECTRCHTEKPVEFLRERAEALWKRVQRTTDVVSGTAPLHANPVALDQATPRSRAAWDIALVLEDPAADAHNAPYAAALLDAAERALGPVGSGAP